MDQTLKNLYINVLKKNYNICIVSQFEGKYNLEMSRPCNDPGLTGSIYTMHLLSAEGLIDINPDTINLRYYMTSLLPIEYINIDFCLKE